MSYVHLIVQILFELIISLMFDYHDYTLSYDIEKVFSYNLNMKFMISHDN